MAGNKEEEEGKTCKTKKKVEEEMVDMKADCVEDPMLGESCSTEIETERVVTEEVVCETDPKKKKDEKAE